MPHELQKVTFTGNDSDVRLNMNIRKSLKNNNSSFGGQDFS